MDDHTPNRITITLKTKEKNVLTFLIDTGAGISLLKKGKAQNQITPETIKLYGINDSTHQPTIGVTQISFHIHNDIINHKFHVVPNEFPIDNVDGLLGMDFLRKTETIVDLKNHRIIINVNINSIIT